MSERVDLLVVGGGINGVGIARDAAGRGLRVLLCEKGDLAGATSSASSKLIHGGLRYLEHGQFRLVREGLTEREVLLRMAPHLVHPLRLILPHGEGARPRWLVRAGLYLYDRLGGARTLPGSRHLDLRRDPLGAPLRDTVRFGFAYSDCATDDARLTVLSARDAALRGAEILTRTELVGARREAGVWRAQLRNADGATREVAARILVNAAGPWAREVLALAGLTIASGGASAIATVFLIGAGVAGVVAAGADLTEVADFPGGTQGKGIRITDQDNGTFGTSPATVVDSGFPIPLDCVTTTDPSAGSNCGVNTTANALVPGVIKNGKGAVWQIGQIEIKDSGPDGVRASADDQVFEVQGVFLP